MAKNIKPLIAPEPENIPPANPQPLPDPPQSQNPPSTDGSIPSIELDAWQSVDLSEIEPHITIDESGEPVIGAAAEFLTKDQFYLGMFKAGLHDMPSMLLKLQSLPIKPHEEDSARAASDALYDTCYEIPWLNFIIRPENVYMQRALVVAAYAVPKFMSVKAEILSRTAQSQQGAGGEHVSTG